MALVDLSARRSKRSLRGFRRTEAASDVVTLGQGARGVRGVVVGVGGASRSALDQAELERRLLEIGFVEGANVEILHEGMFGRDPIAVRLDDMRVALRRREADSVLVRLIDDEDRLEAAE